MLNVAHTLDDLKSAPHLVDGQRYLCLGYAAAGDGGGNEFIYHADGYVAGSHDGGTVIDINGNDTADDPWLEVVDKPEINILAWGAVGDGNTDNTDVFNKAIDYIRNVLSPATYPHIVIPPGTFNIAGTVTSDDFCTWEFRGGVVDVQSTATITINGSVINNSNQLCFRVPSAPDESQSKLKIRSSTSPNLCSPCLPEISPEWFDGSDIGEKVNKAFQVCAGRVVVRLPPGKQTLSTSIDMSDSKLQNSVLVGNSQNGSVLEIANGANIIGINMESSREAQVKDVRVIEASGSRSSCCISIGGTSPVVKGCWFGNAKYGILQRQGNGVKVSDCYVEACDYGVLIGARFADYDVTGLDGVGSHPLTSLYNNLHVFSNGTTTDPEKPGLKVTAYFELALQNASGTFVNGETITGGTSGDTATVVSTDGTSKILIERSADNLFQNLEPITGGTSGATAEIDDRQSGEVRDLQFHNAAIYGNNRHGAIIRHCDFSSFQGLSFHSNGKRNTTPSYGMLIGDGVEECSFIGCGFRQNQPTADPTTYGVVVDSGETSSTTDVKFIGCMFGNSTPSKPQENGMRIEDGQVLLYGCSFTSDLTIKLQDNSGNAVVRDCVNVDDANVDTLARQNDVQLGIFDGTNSYHDTETQFTLASARVTVDALIKVENLSALQFIAAQGAVGGDGGNGWGLAVDTTGRLEFYLYNTANGIFYQERTTSPVITANQVHEISATIDLTGSATASFTVDGVAAATTVSRAETGTYGDQAVNCILGARGTSYISKFNGGIGRVSITDGSTTYTSGALPQYWPGVPHALTAELIADYKYDGEQVIGALSSLHLKERSTDEPDPPEGESRIWQSDGTGTGARGDVLITTTAGGNTRTVNLSQSATTNRKDGADGPIAIPATGTLTINFDSGNADNKRITLDQDLTLTLDASRVGDYNLVLTQDATGGHSVAWPANVIGTPTPVNSIPDSVTVYRLFFDGNNFHF